MVKVRLALFPFRDRVRAAVGELARPPGVPIDVVLSRVLAPVTLVVGAMLFGAALTYAACDRAPPIGMLLTPLMVARADRLPIGLTIGGLTLIDVIAVGLAICCILLPDMFTVRFTIRRSRFRMSRRRFA